MATLFNPQELGYENLLQEINTQRAQEGGLPLVADATVLGWDDKLGHITESLTGQENDLKALKKELTLNPLEKLGEWFTHYSKGRQATKWRERKAEVEQRLDNDRAADPYYVPTFLGIKLRWQAKSIDEMNMKITTADGIMGQIERDREARDNSLTEIKGAMHSIKSVLKRLHDAQEAVSREWTRREEIARVRLEEAVEKTLEEKKFHTVNGETVINGDALDGNIEDVEGLSQTQTVIDPSLDIMSYVGSIEHTNGISITPKAGLNLAFGEVASPLSDIVKVFHDPDTQAMVLRLDLPDNLPADTPRKVEVHAVDASIPQNNGSTTALQLANTLDFSLGRYRIAINLDGIDHIDLDAGLPMEIDPSFGQSRTITHNSCNGFARFTPMIPARLSDLDFSSIVEDSGVPCAPLLVQPAASQQNGQQTP